MTISKKELRERVDKIKDVAWDDELAHSLEDRLLDDFVRYLARRNDYVGEYAKIISESLDLPFERWTA